jgi:hypothetical protein
VAEQFLNFPRRRSRRPLIRTTAHCTQVGFGVKKSWDDPEVSVQQLELLGDRAPLEVYEPDKFILLATE